jgi:PAS domain S-box-containing protein
MNKKQTDQDDTLFGVRRRLLKGMLIALVVLGLPAVVISCIEAIKLGQLAGALLYGGIYLFVTAITFNFHRLPFVFCTGIMLASLYVIAVFNFFQFSFSGAGIEIAITISVLATVLLGIRSGIITAATCLFTLIVIGLCFVYGVINVSSEMPVTTTKAISWVTATAVFTFLTGSLILSSGKLQGYLIKSLESLRYKTEELKEANKALTQEIKQREMTEAKLKQSETQFRTLFETAPDAIYLVDLEGTLLDGNSTAEALVGSPREAFIGKNFIDAGILPEMEIPKAITLMEKSRKGESTGPDELILLSSGGKTTTVEILTSPFQLEDRPVILGIARDISERKQFENQLQQAQKMESVGRLAGGVAHDYNNALTAIMGYTELALIDADPKGNLHEDLNEVLNASRHAKDITRQLLAFARKQTINPKVLDPNTNIESMLKMLRRLIGEDIDLVWLPGKSLWRVKMDPSQIDQILANLCVNARDAIEGVGNITIETATKIFDSDYCADHAGFVPGEFVMLTISDNGCGMDKEILNNIFEPFFTTKAVDKGTGLGLSTVYGIVKQNKGFINVYSEPGKGTTIKIYLPRNDGKAVEIQRGSTKKIPRGHGETILLVEDDFSILKLTKKILNGLGYTVLSDDRPKGAIKLAQDHKGEIHLLVTDVIMPEINGLELSEQLKALYPDLKCVFMSGYTANAIAHHGVLDDEVHFIQKPFSKIDLATIVRKVLDEGKG